MVARVRFELTHFLVMSEIPYQLGHLAILNLAGEPEVESRQTVLETVMLPITSFSYKNGAPNRSRICTKSLEGSYAVQLHHRCKNLVAPVRIELTTYSLGNCRSVQLSYGAILKMADCTRIELVPSA